MKKHLISLAIGIAVVICVVAVALASRQARRLGDANDSYFYKSVVQADASSTAGVRVYGGAGTLHTVVVASSSAAFGLGIRIYDGSTATSSGTLISTIKGNAAEQTFTYDVAVRNGVIVDVPPGYTGSLTFSVR